MKRVDFRCRKSDSRPLARQHIKLQISWRADEYYRLSQKEGRGQRKDKMDVVDDKPRLPPELLRIIFQEAARTDRYSAYALAFTSKLACHWTIKQRWETVVITTAAQFLHFWRIVAKVDEVVFRNVTRGLDITATSFRPAGNQQFVQERVPISYGDIWNDVKNVFIDLSASMSINTLCCDIRSVCRIKGHTLTFAKGSSGTNVAETLEPGRVLTLLPAIRILALGPEESTELVRQELLDDLSVSSYLGAPARQTRRESVHFPQVRELWAVLRGGYSSTELGWDRLRGITTGIVGAAPHLRRVYLTGVDATSPLAGVPLPHFDGNENDHWRLNPSPQISHLRYDTRKFSFKPVESTALRLRPFLQEVTFEVAVDAGPQMDEPASFSHTGPRHAAPPRGAGRSAAMTRSSLPRLQPIESHHGEPAADTLLKESHPGRLEFVHLAWDPIEGPKEDDVPWFRRARFSSGEEERISDEKGLAGGSEARSSISDAFDTGGWPREKKGAWTERSDRDLAPSFAVELRDAIAALYGWDAPGIEAAGRMQTQIRESGKDDGRGRTNIVFSADGAGDFVQRIRLGLKDKDREALGRLQALLDERLAEQGLMKTPRLHYGVKAPRSVVHLGGPAYFQLKQRIRLFEERARGGKGPWP